jgi:NADPH2:quinone reductase
MRAIEAKTFSGYGGLRQTELPKPQPAKDEVLIRVTAAGVTPLDHTILSGGHPRAKAPLVLGNEGAGVVEYAGESGLAVGSRVMFTGPYGVRENGAWQEWLLVRPEHLALVPDAIGDVVAASLPVAYLTAQTTLTLAEFKPGKTMLAPGIGGSVGNATYQLGRASGGLGLGRGLRGRCESRWRDASGRCRCGRPQNCRDSGWPVLIDRAGSGARQAQ